MIYLKSVGAGLVTSVVAVILFLLLQVLTLAIAVAWQSRAAGSVGVGAVSVGVLSRPVMIAAAVGFVVGFWWRLRRQSA